MCGRVDGQARDPVFNETGTYRYNSNENRDLYSDLDRYNVFVFLNHEFENGTEAYTEVSYYRAKTNLFRQPSTMTTGVELTVGAQNYYNPFRAHAVPRIACRRKLLVPISPVPAERC